MAYTALEDMYVLCVADRAVLQWMTAVSTMRKSEVVGLTAPREDDIRGQWWVRYIEHCFADAFKTASVRPHYAFRESSMYSNYLEAGKKYRLKRAPPPPAPTPKVGDPKTNKLREKTSTVAADAKTPTIDEGAPTKKVLYCIPHLAKELGVKGENGCQRGDKCYYSHQFDRAAKTDTEWIELVNSSKVRSEPLKRKLAQAFGQK